MKVKGILLKSLAIAAGIWAFAQFGSNLPSLRGNKGAGN